MIDVLQQLVTANPTIPVMQEMKSPLIAFRSTMEEFAEKLQDGKGLCAKFWKQLTWTM
jgi:hypothetical protein